MILGDIIAEARIMLQDTNATLYRYSDADMLKFANQTLKRIAVLRPDLFAYVGTVTCTAGAVLQSAPADSLRIMEVFGIQGGDAIRETNREILDNTYPDWVNDAAGPAVNWMRHPRANNKFFIYPKAPANQILTVEYAQNPPTYTAGQTVDLLPDAYASVVLDGIIFAAESIDNEHVNSNRAALFQKTFSDALAINMEQRKLTDYETAGMIGQQPQEKIL